MIHGPFLSANLAVLLFEEREDTSAGFISPIDSVLWVGIYARLKRICVCVPKVAKHNSLPLNKETILASTFVISE